MPSEPPARELGRRVQEKQIKASVALAVTALIASCGTSSVPVPASPASPMDESPLASIEETPAASTSAPLPDADLVGVFAGDPQLEAGCTWLTDDAGQRWEILWPDGYRTEFRGELAVLIGPDGETAATSGDRLGVNGAEPAELGSFCMVGRVFQASGVLVVQALDDMLDCDLADVSLCRSVATWALREVGQNRDPQAVRVGEQPACPDTSDCPPSGSQHVAGVRVALANGKEILFNLVESGGEPQLTPAGTE